MRRRPRPRPHYSPGEEFLWRFSRYFFAVVVMYQLLGFLAQQLGWL